MSEARPYSKAQQLGRGTKRYRRKVASPKQWQAITAAKIGPCRVCGSAANNGRVHGRIQFHHVVARDFHGDDLAENIVPLCSDCHELVTHRDREACRVLCASLSDAEYAYAVTKLGEQVFERCYGITYGRWARSVVRGPSMSAAVYGITLVKTAHGFGGAEKGTTVRVVFRTAHERDEAVRRAYRILVRDRPSENPMAWSPTDEQFSAEAEGSQEPPS